MNSSDNYNPTAVFTDVITILYQYVDIPLYIVGNLGNLLSAVIFFQKSWRKNVCVFYCLICLLVDMCYINSSMIANIFINGFNVYLHYSNLILCKLYNFTSFFLSTLKPTILVFASIDRLLISSQNVQTRLYSSRRLAYFSMSIGTTFLFIFFSHVLIKFNFIKTGPFTIICLYNLTDFYRDFVSLSMLTINIILFSLMIILSIISFKNVHQIRSIPREKRQNIRKMHKKDFQLLRCLFVKNIVYIICSFPLVIQAIYGAVIKYQIQTIWIQAFKTFLFNFGVFVYNTHFCTNVFIYAIVSKAFRHHVKRMIYKLFNINIPLLQEEQQNEQVERNKSIEINVVDVNA